MYEYVIHTLLSLSRISQASYLRLAHFTRSLPRKMWQRLGRCGGWKMLQQRQGRLHLICRLIMLNFLCRGIRTGQKDRNIAVLEKTWPGSESVLISAGNAVHICYKWNSSGVEAMLGQARPGPLHVPLSAFYLFLEPTEARDAWRKRNQGRGMWRCTGEAESRGEGVGAGWRVEGVQCVGQASSGSRANRHL